MTNSKLCTERQASRSDLSQFGALYYLLCINCLIDFCQKAYLTNCQVMSQLVVINTF